MIMQAESLEHVLGVDDTYCRLLQLQKSMAMEELEGENPAPAGETWINCLCRTG